MISAKNLKRISIIFYPTTIAIPLILAFSWGMLFEAFLAMIFISIIPFVMVGHYVKKQKIDMDIFEQNKRHIPFIMSLGSFALGVIIFKYIESPLLFTLCLAYLNVTIALLIINIKWKISVHAAGVAGAVTDAVYIFGLFLAPLFLLVPFIAWVRHKMGAHDEWQLLGGSILSISVSLLTFVTFYPI